jgi:hypothetical protein
VSNFALIELRENASKPSRNFWGRSEAVMDGLFSTTSFTAFGGEVPWQATKQVATRKRDVTAPIEALTDNLLDGTTVSTCEAHQERQSYRIDSRID